MSDTLAHEEESIVELTGYAAVNGAWPKQLPKLEGDEAIRAARLLLREGFRFHERMDQVQRKRKFKLTSGRRHNWPRRGVWYINASSGWHSLVHDISHWVHRVVMPMRGGHDLHIMTEKHLVEYVVNSGWLDGKLKRPTKEKVVIDVVAKRAATVEASIAAWNRKLKRAQTALKKLEKKRRYYAKPRPEPKPKVPREKKPPLKQQCLALAKTLDIEIGENDIHVGTHWVGPPDGMTEENDPFTDDGHYVDGWRQVMVRLKAYAAHKEAA